MKVKITDKQRLDWIGRRASSGIEFFYDQRDKVIIWEENGRVYAAGGILGAGKTLRWAIDNAMKNEEK